MKKYHFVGEDEHTFRVRHPDGSEFTIAKQAVGNAVHERIKSLEPIKMAEGGVVPEKEDEFVDTSKFTAEDQSDLGKGFRSFLGLDPKLEDPISMDPDIYGPPIQADVVAPQSQPTPEPMADRMPQSIPDATPSSAPVSTGAPVMPPSPEIPNNAYAQSFAQKESGIKDMASAQAQAGKDQAAAYEAQVAEIAKQQAFYQEERAKLDIEHKQLFDSVMSEKINPDRLWNNMSTGNKITAAISVILGSAGAAAAGQKNIAQEVLNKSIEHDIESQKMEIGKKNTLLSENLRRYGDLNSATQLTMLQMNALTQAKIAQIAARSGSAQAGAQAKLSLAELGLQAAALKEQLAQKQVRSEIMRGGNITDAQAQALPEDDRKRLVKIGGKYTPALDENSAKEARKIVGANDALMSNLDRLIALRQKYGSEFVPGAAKSEMNTIATSLQLAIKEAKQLGTLDKGAEKFLEKLVADPTSIGFVSDQYKALKETQARETVERLKSLGVNTGDLYKEAPQIKIVNGIKYKRGPNGEAIRVN